VDQQAALEHVDSLRSQGIQNLDLKPGEETGRKGVGYVGAHQPTADVRLILDVARPERTVELFAEERREKQRVSVTVVVTEVEISQQLHNDVDVLMIEKLRQLSLDDPL
jgi:hypothetical protein